MQIQPPRAEFPNAGMPIRTFEIRTPTFVLWMNVPATASLVCYQRPAICVRNSLREICILLDGLEAIADG